MQRFKIFVFGRILDTYIRHESPTPVVIIMLFTNIFYQSFIEISIAIQTPMLLLKQKVYSI